MAPLVALNADSGCTLSTGLVERQEGDGGPLTQGEQASKQSDGDLSYLDWAATLRSQAQRQHSSASESAAAEHSGEETTTVWVTDVETVTATVTRADSTSRGAVRPTDQAYSSGAKEETTSSTGSPASSGRQPWSTDGAHEAALTSTTSEWAKEHASSSTAEAEAEWLTSGRGWPTNKSHTLASQPTVTSKTIAGESSATHEEKTSHRHSSTTTSTWPTVASHRLISSTSPASYHSSSIPYHLSYEFHDSSSYLTSESPTHRSSTFSAATTLDSSSLGRSASTTTASSVARGALESAASSGSTGGGTSSGSESSASSTSPLSTTNVASLDPVHQASTSSPSPSSTSIPSSSSSSHLAAILGSTLGALAFLSLLSLAFFFLLRRRRRTSGERYAAVSPSHEPYPTYFPGASAEGGGGERNDEPPPMAAVPREYSRAGGMMRSGYLGLAGPHQPDYGEAGEEEEEEDEREPEILNDDAMLGGAGLSSTREDGARRYEGVSSTEAEDGAEKNLLRAYTPPERDARVVPVVASGHHNENASIPNVGLVPATPTPPASSDVVDRDAESGPLFDGGKRNPFSKEGDLSTDEDEYDAGRTVVAVGERRPWVKAERKRLGGEGSPFFGARMPRA
ncbi:hypothetical protein JCM5296_004011 [Sporobolomyces johnsonii]